MKTAVISQIARQGMSKVACPRLQAGDQLRTLGCMRQTSTPFSGLKPQAGTLIHV